MPTELRRREREVNNLRITRSAGASQEVVEYPLRRRSRNLAIDQRKVATTTKPVRTTQSDDLETYTKERTISDQSGRNTSARGRTVGATDLWRPQSARDCRSRRRGNDHHLGVLYRRRPTRIAGTDQTSRAFKRSLDPLPLRQVRAQNQNHHSVSRSARGSHRRPMRRIRNHLCRSRS